MQFIEKKLETSQKSKLCDTPSKMMGPEHGIAPSTSNSTSQTTNFSKKHWKNTTTPNLGLNKEKGLEFVFDLKAFLML